MKNFSFAFSVLMGAAFLSGSALGNSDLSGQINKNVSQNVEAKRRAELTYKIVKKWGPYVEDVYRIPARRWAMEMLPLFKTTPLDYIEMAARAKTFDAVNDALLQTKVANTARPLLTTETGRTVSVSEKKFGDLTQDLVYTPIQPCRILDTRSTAALAIPDNTTRSFVAVNASNFTGQGGSNTNCGTLSLAATAVAINFTVVSPSAQGYMTAFPYGTAQPLAATMVYKSGEVLSNSAIVQIPNPVALFDFTIYSLKSAHYVADIVGYFAPPLATALQCVETANENLDIVGNGGTGNVVAPGCATGYTQTATNCETTSWLMPIVFFQSGTCSARNGDAATRTLRASRTCCRVPGR